MAGALHEPVEWGVEDGVLRIAPQGEWTIGVAVRLDSALRAIRAPAGTGRVEIDCAQLAALDTAGSMILVRHRAAWRERGLPAEFVNLSEIHRVLIDEVAEHPLVAAPSPEEVGWAIRILEDTGRSVAGSGRDAVRITAFLGAVVTALARVVISPSRLRFTSIVYHMEHVGFRGIGIIALLSFLIGGIIAQQGAFQLRKFGAELLVVDLVGILVLRELGVLVTAILYAGRSGSAFTAEIGAMKMREEIDAMRIIGLDPVETLFLPRLIALVLTLPMVTFISDLAALIGGGLVCYYYIDLSPDAFVTRLRDGIGMNTFLVGLFKAPFMALVIGLVACVEGMKVTGSAESLGRQTTASVVKSIFIVILLDGIFAMFLSAVEW